MCAGPVLQAVGPNTRLGDLVDSNQRAIIVFYDEWVTPHGYTIGGKVRKGARTLMQVFLGLGFTLFNAADARCQPPKVSVQHCTLLACRPAHPPNSHLSLTPAGVPPWPFPYTNSLC